MQESERYSFEWSGQSTAYFVMRVLLSIRAIIASVRCQRTIIYDSKCFEETTTVSLFG